MDLFTPWMIVPAILFLLIAGTIFHMCLRYPRRVSSYHPKPDPEKEEMYAEKLSVMLQCDTVSLRGVPDPVKFRSFHRRLETLFPLVHACLEKTEIDGNLLFCWKGKSSERPLVLMSHMDTVPAEGEWKYPPFSGKIAEGRVWGRGAFDTKCSVMGFFQAVEELLEEGFVPPQDVYLSSSCTEETGGGGCAALVSELERRGVKPFLVCDEGGAIMEDPLPGVKGCFAMVGVQEKGAANVDFIAKSGGGHASTPERQSPVARLADFIHQIEHHDPFQTKMPYPVKRMLQALAPYGSLPVRYVFSNLWLFGPLVAKVMPRLSPQAAAMLRTTIAFTVQSGSEAYNVLPAAALTGANLRFIPHQPMEESLHVVEQIAGRYGLETRVLHAEDVSHQTDLESPAWKLLTDTIRVSFPGVGISPYILTGGTDARFYERICPSVVRFAPVVEGTAEKKGMHGINESITVRCLPGCVRFYRNLICSNL